MNHSETLLEIKDLCVEFKTMAGTVHAVDHLSYTLHRGEKLSIVGESGSGKSVSSLAMMQLIPNPPGKVTGGQIPGTYDFFKPHHPLWKADCRVFTASQRNEKERSHGRGH